MPALGRVGVSRKIEDDDLRRSLRDMMLDLNPPKGIGFIVRTAGQDRTRKELSRDMAYLVRLWKVNARRVKKNDGPVDIYEESDMIIRTIRDVFTGDVDSIYIDEPTAYERLKLRLVGRPEVVILDTLHEPIVADEVRGLQQRLGLMPGRYLALCPGGGGMSSPTSRPART